MLRQILVGAVGAGTLATLLALAGCGQKGGLFLPQEPAATGRATLPEAVRSSLPGVGGTGANSPAPALPAPPARVTAPTPAASAPLAAPAASSGLPR